MKPLSEPQGDVTPPEDDGDGASSDLGHSFLRDVTPDSSPYVVPVFLRVGEVLGGRFAVHGFVQRGGMGTIYRAFDLQTGQPVAVKVLSCLDPDARERFAREAEILSDLSHPGVVQHVAHGTIREGAPYLVMEWLHGEDLFQRLQRKALDHAESLALLRRACEALFAAHIRGIVHRDIKPANLFLANTDPGCVKLLDFGVARLGDTVQSLTRRGNLIGTVGYMAPEQVRGEEDVDARADLFSLGCVLYECLTGRPPFESAYSFGVLAKVLHEEPRRPSHVSTGVDPRFDTLVARLLAKNREERFPDAAAVLRELETFDEHPGSSAPARRLLLSAIPSEQRIVSVILGNSTELKKSAQLLASFSDCGLLDDLSRRFGAEVSSLKGGGVLLVLSGRGEATDQASQAALCALGLQQGRPDLKLVVTTGLAETTGGITVGAAIDRAAALLNEALAEPAGVFLDEVTAGLIAIRFEIKCIGSTHLLQGPRRDLDTPHLLMGRPTPHVGRDREILMLDGMLEECVSESVSRMVLITGPPGIGKSRLAGEWLARAREQGSLRTFFARGEPGAGGPVLGLVKQLLRSAARLREYDDSRAQRTALEGLVQRTVNGTPTDQLLQVLAEFLGIPLGSEPTPIVRAVRASAEILREQVRRALHSWLDGETRQTPVLLVLEDLHWSDSPSVTLLSEILRSLSQRPLMILALARPEAEQLFSKLPSVVAVHMRLLGLAPRAAQQLIGAALDTKLPDDVVSRLVRTADGNAFYLEELIRRVASGTTEWPDTVLAMAQSRIEQLKPMARTVLRAASVFGERCWDVAIQEMFDGLGEAKQVLNLLADEELLVRVPESRYVHAHEYRFRHALLRDAAYAMMTDEERRVAHGLIGEWLQRSGDTDARALADHYEAAGFSERALPYLVRAAKAAIDVGDISATIELADRGVSLGASGVARGRLLLLRSFAEFLRGPPNLSVTREAVDLLPIGTAAWWLGVGVLILGSCTYGRASEAMPYVTLAEDAPFTKEHDVPISQGLLTLVGGLVLLGKGDVAERIVDRAAAAATTDQDPVFETFLASARCALASVAPVRGHWQLEEALYEGRRCSATLAELGAIHGQFVVLYYLAIAAMHLGRYEEAREACERSVELNHQTGLNDGWPRLFLAKAYLRLNRPKEALDAIEALRSSPDWAVQQMIPVIVSEAYLRLGDAEKAEHEATPSCSGVSPRLRRLAACVLARAQLMLERPEDALTTADRALLVPSSNGLESDIELLTVRAEALCACGRLEEASRAVAIASDLVDCIAEDIDDPDLKWSFLELVEPCARARTLQRRLAEIGHQ